MREPPPIHPLNPVKVAPAFRVTVPVVFVTVPLPLKVPLRVIELKVGLLPSGREQLLLIVFSPELLITTALKVTLLQLKVVVDPSNVTVPPLALNVGEPEIVSAPASVKVPDGAVNVPDVRLKVLFISTVV